MNLYHKEWNWSIEFSENRAFVLILEDPKVFSQVVQEIWDQVNGGEEKLVLADGGKELRLSKEAECIINPFALDCNNKKIATQLFKEMAEEVQNYYFENSIRLHSEIISFLDLVSEKIEYPVTYELEPRINELFKAYNVRIEEMGDTLLEKLICYIRLMNKACHIALFIILNLRQLFDDLEIQYLYEILFYEKISILSIESREASFFPCEDVLVIDRDLCCIRF